MRENNIKILKRYIKSLVKNIEFNNVFNKPSEIDVIYSGGALNGGYGFGISLFLQELEREKKIKINKISGCSIGGFIGFVHLMEQYERNEEIEIEIEYIFEKIKKCFKNKFNIVVFKKCIKKVVNSYFNFLLKKDNTLEDILNIVNDRLFITYYDIEQGEKIIKNKYKSKKEIIETLIKTSFLPFITDGNLCYKNKYIDGMTPYIFKYNNQSNNKCLFVELLTREKMWNSIFSNKEKNIHYRIITGVVDINRFLTEGSSNMCSWVNEWKIHNYLIKKIIEIIIYVFINLMIFLSSIEIKREINKIKSSKVCKTLISMVMDLLNDIVCKVV